MSGIHKNQDYSIVSWRAWYTDGRVFESTKTTWEELPSDGALLFVLYCKNERHRRIMAGVSLYWKEVTPKGTIYACDNAADALIPEDLESRFIKRGKWVPDEEFRAVYDNALEAQRLELNA